MYLFLFDVTPLENAALFAHGLGLLSPERANKVLTLRSLQARRLSLGAGLVLRHGLALLGCSERESGIQANAWGKPCCVYMPHIQFNVSHSGSLVLGGFVVGYRVGVDVEKITDRNATMDILALSKRFFHPHEHELLLQEAPAGRTRLYFRIWTRKESCLKADGRGLAASTTSFTVLPDNDEGIVLDGTTWHIREYFATGEHATEEHILGEYALAVCTNSRDFADAPVPLYIDQLLVQYEGRV